MRVRVDPIQRAAPLFMILLLTGLLGYALPWAVTSSAPMTLNAFDLAEWASLHPAQRHTSPPLLAPLLLRAQLLILTLILALTMSRQPYKLLSTIAVVVLALAQLPPFEYVYDIANVNYRQQFGLALASLLAGLVITRLGTGRIKGTLLVVLPIVGVVSLFVGASQALDVYRRLQPVANVGLGPWLLIASYTGVAVTGLLATRPGAANTMN